MSIIEEMFSACLRASVVLTIAGVLLGLALSALRPVSVRLHRFAWAVVLLCGLMIVPVTVPVPSSWTRLPGGNIREQVPQSSNATEHPVAINDTVSPEGTSSDPNTPSVPDLPPEHVVIASGPNPGAAEESTVVHTQRTTSRYKSDPAMPQSAEEADVNRRRLKTVVAAVWISGIVGGVCLGVISWLLLLLALRRSRPAPHEQQQQANDLATERGRRQAPILLLHPSWGPGLCLTHRGYRLVVPEQTWSALNHEQRGAVLQHELAHWTRGDVLKSLLARGLGLLHWFNPVVWWAVRRFEEAAEWACDDTLSRDPDQVTALSQALLTFVEQPTHRWHSVAGVSSARGASLCHRVQRLLDDSLTSGKDSVMKQMTITTTMLICLSAGALQFRVLAEPAENLSPAERSTDQDNSRRTSAPAASGNSGPAEESTGDTPAPQINRPKTAAPISPPNHIKELNLSWIHQLDSGDQLAMDLRKVLLTEAGQERLLQTSRQAGISARNDAVIRIVPEILESRLHKTQAGYVVPDEQRAWWQEFLQSARQVDEELQMLKTMLLQVAAGLNGKNTGEELLARFLRSEAAPVVFRELRAASGTVMNAATLGTATQGMFVQGDDGIIRIPASQRDKAGQLLTALQQIIEIQPATQTELQVLTAELCEAKGIYKSMRTVLSGPRFTAAIVTQGLDRKSVAVSRILDEFHEFLETTTSDSINGLMIAKNHEGSWWLILNRVRRQQNTAVMIRSHVQQLQEVFSTEDQLHVEWGQMLTSDPMLLFLSSRLLDDRGRLRGQDGHPTPRNTLQDVLTSITIRNGSIEEDDLAVLQNYTQELYTQFRKIRRQTRQLQILTGRIEDVEIHDACRRWGGRLMLRQLVEEQLDEIEANGQDLWLDQHFKQENGTWFIRDSSRDAISELTQDIQSHLSQLSATEPSGSSETPTAARHAVNLVVPALGATTMNERIFSFHFGLLR